VSASQGLGAEAGLLGQRALGFQPGDTEGVLDVVQRTDIKSLWPRGDDSLDAAVHVNVFSTLIGIASINSPWRLTALTPTPKPASRRPLTPKSKAWRAL
jgi:hypothetical protein